MPSKAGKSKKKCSDSLTIGVAPDTAERGLIKSIGLYVEAQTSQLSPY